jgi:hypothetical protein
VDGGTFNNEPIREAFRLASFMDALNPDEDFERLILFVDPHVVVPEPDLGLPFHARWLGGREGGFLKPGTGKAVERKSSLDRLIPVTRSLVRAVTNESRVVEADKVFRTRKNFRIRNLIREDLKGALERSPQPSVLKSLVERLQVLLEVDRTGVMIPAGAVSLEGELRRVIAEEGDPDRPLHSLRPKSPMEIEAFVSSPEGVPQEERGSWLKALVFVSVDRVMDLEGKMERSQLVAISPATDPSDPGRMEELPGRIVNGFGGFMSSLAGRHEVRVARYCTQIFLQAAGRVAMGDLPEKPDFSPQRRQFMNEVRAGLAAVEDRVVDLLADSHLEFVGGLPRGVLKYLVKDKLVGLADEGTDETVHELRLQVPGMRYEWDGSGLPDRDLKPHKIRGNYFLITFATHRPGAKRPWRGPAVAKKKQVLKVDRDRKGFRPDREFCRVALPTPAMLEAGRRVPHPVWVARLKKKDRGHHLGSDRWRLLDEVEGLEGTIFRS